jgi:hypothetical protein
LTPDTSRSAAQPYPTLNCYFKSKSRQILLTIHTRAYTNHYCLSFVHRYTITSAAMTGRRRMPAMERRGETLIVRFPVADHFECTEAGCRATFKAANWTATRRSLERHLERDHNIRIRSTLCCKCNSAIGIRPTGHSCSFPTPQGVRTAEPAVFAVRCEQCEQTFPTKIGLHNHQQWHLQQERRARKTVELPRPLKENPGDGGWWLYPSPRSPQ